MKRILVLFLLGWCTMLPTVVAENYSGTCGTGLTWTLDTTTGLLVIRGTGRMTEFAAGGQPWYAYRESITSCRVEAGVLYVAENAFYNCNRLVNLSYPLDLEETFPSFECTPKTTPIVVTNDATGIKMNEAVLNAQVTSDGGLPVTERGICWGITSDALTNCQSLGTGTGSFNESITGLSEQTTYYFQAYATNELGTEKGEVKSFTTTKKEGGKGTDCGHDWVQLWEGGPKWATMNMGASNEYEDGDYYAFAEVATKTSYSHNNYAYKLNAAGGTSPYSNYNDGKAQELKTEHDAAIQNWGCDWRMPTRQEMKDLIDKCTWTFEYNTSASPRYAGYRIKSKEAGNTNSIFLPLAGYFYTARWSYQSFPDLHPGVMPSFWGAYYGTSTTSGVNTQNSWYTLQFRMKKLTPEVEMTPTISLYTRSNGITIRPVCDK